MREIAVNELALVSGGGDECTSGNSYGGVNDPSSLGDDLISLYEGVVRATSHVIERVAMAF